MLLNSALWLVCISLILVSVLKDMVGYVDKIRYGEKSYIILLIINIIVAVFCCFAISKHVKIIRNYDKHPKVITTEAPKTDTLQRDGKTLHLYEFKDNYNGKYGI